jgi:hypothetical protein
MNKKVKITFISLFGAGTILFAVLFYSHYTNFMDEAQKAADQDRVEQLTQTGKTRVAPAGYVRVMVFGACFVLFALCLGLMGGHELSEFVAEKMVKHLYDDEGEPMGKEYDLAEETWANGNYLEAINLLRDYYKKHPNQVHVGIRIAEIYEKDLNNPLAAALELEEVLTHKLKPDNWGWTAIHLCNVYITKLKQKDKAIGLLLKIDAEYGNTTAAEKARKRLAMYANEALNAGELTGVGAESIEEDTSTGTAAPASTTDQSAPGQNPYFKKLKR